MSKLNFFTIFKWIIIFTSLQIQVSLADTMRLNERQLISYTDAGNGTPLVLIHAFPTDKRLWQPQAVLSNHFRVITLDLPGFGQSSSVDGHAITMKEYATDVNGLLDKLHIKQAVIVGESMGGYIALAFLNQYPDKVEGLVLSDTQSIADDENTKLKREVTAKDILKNGTTNFINSFLPKALSAKPSPKTTKMLKDILDKQSAVGMASALRGMAQRNDTSNMLSSTIVPVLIITGANDTLIPPKQSKSMHQLAKNGTLVVIANAGHLSNLEQPEAWNQAVIQVFDSSK